MTSHASRRRGAIAATLTTAALIAASTAFAQTTSQTDATGLGETQVEGAEPDAQTLSRDRARPSATLRTSRKRVRSGQRLRLKGRVSTKRRHEVRLMFRPRGADRWSRAARTNTNAKGRFRINKRQRVTGRWRVIPRNGKPSASRPVGVRAKVQRLRIKRTVVSGNSARIRGQVVPNGNRRVVVRVGGQRIVRRTNGNGHFSARWSAGGPGARQVRINVGGNRRAQGFNRRAGKIRAFRRGHASYYGPGFYGGRTACGQTLTPSTQGVAHKTLPCGTRVTFRYRGRQTTVRVIDRGPFIPGRDWDLTSATRNSLGFGSTGTVLSTR